MPYKQNTVFNEVGTVEKCLLTINKRGTDDKLHISCYAHHLKFNRLVRDRTMHISHHLAFYSSIIFL